LLTNDAAAGLIGPPLCFLRHRAIANRHVVYLFMLRIVAFTKIFLSKRRRSVVVATEQRARP
jgi:hypothetical protein